MFCNICKNEMIEIRCENISMTQDRIEYSCDNCGKIYTYKIPTRGW